MPDLPPVRELPEIEQRLFSAVNREEFHAACAACFAGQSGEMLLRALLMLRHPLYPPAGRDVHETYRFIGQAEIVSLLLRYSGEKGAWKTDNGEWIVDNRAEVRR